MKFSWLQYMLLDKNIHGFYRVQNKIDRRNAGNWFQMVLKCHLLAMFDKNLHFFNWFFFLFHDSIFVKGCLRIEKIYDLIRSFINFFVQASFVMIRRTQLLALCICQSLLNKTQKNWVQDRSQMLLKLLTLKKTP